jgi:hypothetical protein
MSKDSERNQAMSQDSDESYIFLGSMLDHLVRHDFDNLVRLNVGPQDSDESYIFFLLIS